MRLLLADVPGDQLDHADEKAESWIKAYYGPERGDCSYAVSRSGIGFDPPYRRCRMLPLEGADACAAHGGPVREKNPRRIRVENDKLRQMTELEIHFHRWMLHGLELPPTIVKYVDTMMRHPSTDGPKDVSRGVADSAG